jgi:hypothetical protein
MFWKEFNDKCKLSEELTPSNINVTVEMLVFYMVKKLNSMAFLEFSEVTTKPDSNPFCAT